MKRLLFLILLIPSLALAADTLLCTDDNDDGSISVLRGVGVIDRDCDHEASASDGGGDCDDTRWDIYDGAYDSVGCSAGQQRQCVAGVYTSCSAADLNQQTHMYFVSGAGSGTQCTSASPCTIAAVSTGGTVTITSPAEIVLIGSTDITTSTGFVTAVSGISTSNRNIFRRDRRSTAKFNITGGSCATSCASIKINADNWIVADFEVTGGDATGSGGIRAEADNIEIVGNWVHDVVCEANFNCAGIYFGESHTNIWIHDNNVVNAYDPDLTSSGDDRQNVYLIGGFRGSGHIIEANHVAYNHAVNTTPYEKQGGNIRIKHGLSKAEENTKIQIRYNVMANGEYAGCMVGSANTWCYGNLILGTSHSVWVLPGFGGGNAAWDNIVVKNNTIVSGAHYYLGTAQYGAITMSGATTETSVGGVVVTGNVIDDSAQTTYGGGNYNGMVVIDPYGADAAFTAIITGGVLSFGGAGSLSNCYYNSAIAGLTGGFCVYCDPGASAGSTVNYSGWKSPYSYDTTGTANANPTLDANYRVTTTCTTGTGWEAEWATSSTTSTTTTTTLIAAIRGGIRFRLRLR